MGCRLQVREVQGAPRCARWGVVAVLCGRWSTRPSTKRKSGAWRGPGVSPEEKLRHWRVPKSKHSDSIGDESALLWALTSRKGNSLCVNDTSVAPWCAQATALPHCGDREGPRARWPLGGSGWHV